MQNWIEIVDAGLELHKKRASVAALNSFVTHLTKQSFHVKDAQFLCALNSKAYSLSWQVLDADGLGASQELEASPSFNSQSGVARIQDYAFALEVKAKGKKEVRISTARKALAKHQAGEVSIVPAPLPLLPGVGEDKHQYEASSLTLPYYTGPVPPDAVSNGSPLERKEHEPFQPHECLACLKQQDFYEDQLVFHTMFEKREATYVSVDEVHCLSPHVRWALAREWQVSQLYLHQAQAITASLEGKDILLLTGTGSGKTLCFVTTFMQMMSEFRGVMDQVCGDVGGGFLVNQEENAAPAAIFLYPTKALAQDQLRGLAKAFNHEEICVKALDGDSSPSEREDALQRADVILTNPDFLHCTVLPQHDTRWRFFLRRISMIVVDEGHVYNGIFGCHFALVMRRLLRLLQSPEKCRIFVCSATISNPQETFHRLFGDPTRQVQIVERDCSPTGERVIGMWRPKERSTLVSSDAEQLRKQKKQIVDPFVEMETIQRCSAIFEMGRLLASLIVQGVRTLAFCKTRKLVELVLKYSRDQLKRMDRDDLTHLVVGYRAGYTKEERRDIESRMFSKQLLAVCCTSALELGIDLGYLDAVLILGFSNTLSSTLQMFGRSGRSGRNCLNLIVTFDSPLDNLIISQPSLLLDRKSEPSAVFDPMNEVILKKHLLCAAREQFIHGTFDFLLFGGWQSFDFMRVMEEDGLLVYMPLSTNGESKKMKPSPEQEREIEAHYRFRAHDKVNKPHDFSLRVMESIQIRVTCDGVLLDLIEYSRAFYELFPGAIYLHQCQTFCILSLDLHINKEAKAKRVDVDYYTSPLDSADITILKIFDTRSHHVHSGLIKVARNITGFKKRRFMQSEQAHGASEKFPVSLPKLEFKTRGTWIDLGEDFCIHNLGFGVHAAEHVLVKVLPQFLLSHSSSVGTTHSGGHGDSEGRGCGIAKQLMVFDQHPGGIGIAEAIFSRFPEIIEASLKHVQNCACYEGCTQCVLDSMCSDFNQKCDKQAGIQVLRRAYELIEAGKDMTTFAKNTPEKRNHRRATSLARERADGTTVAPLWKLHLRELGSESVNYNSEL